MGEGHGQKAEVPCALLAAPLPRTLVGILIFTPHHPSSFGPYWEFPSRIPGFRSTPNLLGQVIFTVLDTSFPMWYTGAWRKPRPWHVIMLAHEQLASTKLPCGYDKHQLFLRRWLLNLRSRVSQLPAERQRMLEAVAYEFHPKAGKPGHGTRATNAYLLANAI